MGNSESSSTPSTVDVSTSTSIRASRRTSDIHSSSGSKTPASSVHGNLMRTHHVDPMKYYTVCAILGEGSMGSVSKVKKKISARGGSARPAFVKRRHGCCFQLLSFLHLPGGYTEKKFVDFSEDIDSNRSGYSSVTSSYRPASSAPASRSATPTQKSHKLDTIGADGELKKDLLPRKTNATNKKQLRHAGSSSMISYGTKKDSCYALKTILLDRCSSIEFKEELKNEVEILKSLDHPNIVRAIETFDYRDRLYIVLELCSGGDLYTRDPYNEEQAAKIIFCLAKAISYLHSKGIVHRDIKFENICYSDDSPGAEIKLIDFGLSQKFAANEHLHDTVGTVYTMAPELLEGDYGAKADVWSLGVISFMLLSSSMPFYGKDRNYVIKKILRGRFHFSSRRWRYVSDDAKLFIKSLLRRKPERRPTAEIVCNAPWLNQDFSSSAISEDIDEMDKIQASIQAFSQYQTLKKLALMVIAYKSTTEEIGILRKIWNRLDSSKDGEMSLVEFKDSLNDYNYSEEEIELMFQGIDIDGTGTVHYIEFLAATIESHGSIDEERIAEAFDRIDSDDSGVISVGDLREFLGDDIPDSYLERVIDDANVSRDHTISYEQFLALWDTRAEEAIKKAKADVGSRRVSRQSSLVSSTSTDNLSDAGDFSTTSSGELETGSFFYMKQKEISVRNDNELFNMDNAAKRRAGSMKQLQMTTPFEELLKKKEGREKILYEDMLEGSDGT